MNDIQSFLSAILDFFNGVLIPFLFGVALLIFLYNALRFFIIGSSNPDDKESAKRLAIYGILGFVFLVSLWGIINLLVFGLGFNRQATITPDYINVERGNTDFGFDVQGYLEI